MIREISEKLVIQFKSMVFSICGKILCNQYPVFSGYLIPLGMSRNILHYVTIQSFDPLL